MVAELFLKARLRTKPASIFSSLLFFGPIRVGRTHGGVCFLLTSPELSTRRISLIERLLHALQSLK
jgi:hypothetical protein